MEPDSQPIDTRKYLSEFLGTFILVTTVCFNVKVGAQVAPWAVTSIACSLMVSIYVFGRISGGHLNPAVTIAAKIANTEFITTRDMIGYIVVQLLGGTTASLLCGAVLQGNAIELNPVGAWWQAGLAELLYTFMLCFVVLNVAYSKDKGNRYYGLAIGFSVVAGGYGAGHISGGCFNPAVALGVDVAGVFHSGMTFWCLLYTCFEIVGALLAAVLFKVIRNDEDTLFAKLLSEFLGTYMLVLTVGLNVIGGSKAAAFSIAASLMCMIFALGSVSGAHFNPAVTLANMLCKKENPRDSLLYMAAQVVGGIAAAFTYALMEGTTFPLAKSTKHSWGEVAFAEVIFTFVLALVVLGVAAACPKGEELKEYFGLAIGSCVIAGGFAAGPISGGVLNPAVAIGISTSYLLAGGLAEFHHCLLFSLLELAGGALAAGVFLHVSGDPVKSK